MTMQRAAITPTATQALWTMIRQSTNALSFQNYQAFMEQVLCGVYPDDGAPSTTQRTSRVHWRRPPTSCRGDFPSRASSRTGS